jgi:aspartate aminotransferase
MTTKVSLMAENLIGSEIIKLAGEIKSRIAQGEHIYNLTIGDFNSSIFPIPYELTQAIEQAYKSGETTYPAANGMQPLREEVAAFLKRKGNLDYDPEDILISSGARPLIFALYMVLLDPGDKVIYPLPSWNNNHYTHIGRGVRQEVIARPEANFMPLAEDIEPHIHDATLIAVCSPLNPTGTIFSKEQLSDICEMIIAENKRRGPDQKPLYLLYDQIYWQLVYGENKHYNPVELYPEMRNYAVCIDGMSKAFCATGVRVGWAFGPSYLIKKMRSICSHVGAWAPRAEQMATAAYLAQDEAVDQFLETNRSKLSQRLNTFYEGLQGLKAKGLALDAIVPQAALYLTVKFDLVGHATADGNILENNHQVHRYILDEGKVALVPFGAFGTNDSHWYRLSVGTTAMEDIPDIISRLGAAIEKLQVPAMGV